MIRKQISDNNDGTPKESRQPVPRLRQRSVTMVSASDHWTGMLLHQLHQVAEIAYSNRMAELSLRPIHIGILQILAEEEPLVQARLGDRLSIDKASVVASLNTLEERGLVRRRNHPDDERSFLVYLLEPGKEILAKAENLNDSVSREFFSPLGDEQKSQLHGLLQELAKFHLIRNKGVHPEGR